MSAARDRDAVASGFDGAVIASSEPDGAVTAWSHPGVGGGPRGPRRGGGPWWPRRRRCARSCGIPRGWSRLFGGRGCADPARVSRVGEGRGGGRLVLSIRRRVRWSSSSARASTSSRIRRRRLHREPTDPSLFAGVRRISSGVGCAGSLGRVAWGAAAEFLMFEFTSSSGYSIMPSRPGCPSPGAVSGGWTRAWVRWRGCGRCCRRWSARRG